MKTPLAFFALACGLLIFQGVFSTVIPPQLCPDFALLFVAGLAFRLSSLQGLLFAALIGYLADHLSGTLLGEHSILYTTMFLFMRVLNHQTDLSGALRQSLVVGLLTLLQALGLIWIAYFLREQSLLPLVLDGGLWTQALVNALAAPFFLGWFLRFMRGRDAESPLSRHARGQEVLR
jgi:rod shape-determining protein MreD